VLESLDAAAVHRWCAVGLDALRRHQQEIDALNVYPVADSDTGTNLVLTLTAAHEALAGGAEALAGKAEAGGAEGGGAEGGGAEALAGGGEAGGEPLAEVLRRMARGALLGARGNSGAIMSQLLKGASDALAQVPIVRGRALAGALDEAVRAAYQAVSEPAEGTLLSVARAAAQAAAEVDSDELATVVKAATIGAAEALARTPEQLPVLARAGVVDAGGRGLCVLLDALAEVVTGSTAGSAAAAPGTVPAAPRPLTTSREAGSDAYAYEVQYLLDAAEPAVRSLRARLTQLGDSLVVVGTGDGTWSVHVHVNDVGAAIEAGIEAGRPYRIRVTRFAEQAAPEPQPPDPQARAAIVVATGAGLAEVLRGEGAAVVPGPSPSSGEILAAIRASGAGRVVVLPGDRGTQEVAAEAAAQARAEGIRVGVVPTRSPVQALAALAVRDAGRRFEDDMIAMAEAAGACRYAEVTTAGWEAVTVAGVCRPGDVLALVEGEVNLIGDDLVQTCRDLVDRLLAAGGELVTLVTGEGAPVELTAALCEHLNRRWPFVEVQVFDGGQPAYPLVVGVE
jgi:DAK2 domain fusion protein YloV